MSEAAQRIADSRVRLVLSHPWWAALLLKLDPIEMTAEEMQRACGMPTAATDGTKIYYCPEFIKTLDNGQVAGLLLHEALHCGFLHHLRQGDRDDRKWNVACDEAVNNLLKSDGITLPEGGVCTAKYEKLAAEDIYDLLKPQDMPKWGGVMSGTGNPEDGPSEQEWQEAMVQALHQAAQAGRLPGQVDRLLKDYLAPPKVPWLDVLKHLVIKAMGKSDYTWKRPNRRGLAHGLYLPSMEGTECRPLAFAIDTSGSMSEDDISKCIREVRGCIGELTPSGSLIMEADATVQSVKELDKYEEYVPTKAKGGGGTDFVPALKYAEDKGACILIYFTDLEGNFGVEPRIPVIWVTENKGKKAPYGDTILIKE
jgi:predicted metal-dependent peptidase